MTKLVLTTAIPDLNKLEVASCDLSLEYWTPAEYGERRRMIFMGIQTRCVPDSKDPAKSIDLPCAVFIVPGSDDNHKTVVNGSKRLVAVFENNAIEDGTAVQVTYKGKKKNRTNANMSDDWAVVTLKAKGQ